MATAENTETILTENEAAKFLKVSAMTLQRHRTAKAIGFYKVGARRIAYSMEKHLLPFLESCDQKPSAQTNAE